MESGFLVSGDGEDNNKAEESSGPTMEKSARVTLYWPENRKYGEGFERYYRKELLRKTGNPVRIISTEPLFKVSSTELVNEVFADRQKTLLEISEKLTGELYRLSSEVWESNPNAYLRLIDRFITQLSTAESRYVLRHSQRIFKERFGEIIRDRGESVELLDQIVKRTGEETEEGFLKVLSGVDATDLAWRIWSLVQRYTPDVNTRVERILFDLTDYQIRELRLEYNSLPAVLLAKELYRALHAAPDPPEPTEEELLALEQEKEQEEEWNEEEDPWGFTRVEKVEIEIEKYVIDFEAMRYVLRGRTVEEIALIEFQFNDMYHRLNGENTLRGQVQDRMLSWKGAEILDRLEGFNAEREAAVISEVFWDDDRISEDEIVPDELSTEGSPEEESEGRDLFLEAQISGKWPLYEDLAGRFRKMRLLCSDMAVWEREYDALPQLKRAVRHLSPQQFDQVNEVLAEEHGFELDAALYRNGMYFNARSAVEELIVLLPLASTLREILDFFEYLPPEEIADLKRIYPFVAGRDLFKDVQSSIRALCGEELPEMVNQMIASRLSGIPRVKLEQDLLLPFSPDVVNAPDHTLSEDALDNFFRLTTEHVWTTLLSSLKGLLPVQRLQVEEDFFRRQRKLNQSQTLRDVLLSFSEDLAAHEAALLLSGFDAREAVARIEEDVTELSTLRAELPSAIALVMRILDDKGIDVQSQLEQAPDDSTALLMRPYLKTILFAPEALELGRVLKRFRPLAEDDLNFLAEALSHDFEDVSAFERAFDRIFGSLRLLLKQLASAGCLDRENLGFSILRLEGADPGLYVRLHKLVGIADFETVQQLFKDQDEHLVTIEECYDVVYQEKDLRSALNHMDASLNAICRCLLLLDGYDPAAISAQIIEILESSKGSEAAVSVMELLKPGEEDDPNPYIPEDPNWVDEMYLQIRHAYREEKGHELLPVLVNEGLDAEQHKELTYRLYGTRVAEKAAEVYSFIRGKDAGKNGLEKVRKVLGTIDPRLRECVVSLYNSYFAVRPGHRPLESEIKAASGDPEQKKKLLKIVQDAKDAIHL